MPRRNAGRPLYAIMPRQLWPVIFVWWSRRLCRKFCSEVVEGQLPLSVEGLNGQGVEQFGRSEPLVSGLEYHLFFLDHVHEFDSNQGVLGCLKRFEP